MFSISFNMVDGLRSNSLKNASTLASWTDHLPSNASKLSEVVCCASFLYEYARKGEETN